MSGTQVLKRLITMKREPQKGWTADDIAFVCRGCGLDYAERRNESNLVVSHPKIDGLLTIPARRKIKPFYVMLFVQLTERALEVG